MQVDLTPELEAQLNELAELSGRSADELAKDAIAGMVEDLAVTRAMLDSRYSDFKSTVVSPIDGEAFFETLCLREEGLLKRRSS
jgi:hypothetical protein